jgi:hypothetical protein
VELTPVNGAAPATSVDFAGTLRDALDAVLRSSDGRAGVIKAGQAVGVVDADVIRAASLRAR